MKSSLGISSIQYRNPSIVSVGTFDGVHRGHQEIIKRVVERAHQFNAQSIIITFEPHPREIIHRDGVEFRLLTTLTERKYHLENLGVDDLIVLEFSLDFAKLNPKEFYQKYIIERINVAGVVEGYDHHFGFNRSAGLEQIQQYADQFSFWLEAVNPVLVDNIPVSSTKIRKSLLNADIDTANKLLGRNYELAGKVVHGAHKGKGFGFPTANLELEHPSKLIPADGVYITTVIVGNKATELYGLTNIGVRPTVVQNGKRTVEVYILDFDEEIYDERIEIHFLKRLRGEQRFNSINELIAQMERDRDEASAFISDESLLKTKLHFTKYITAGNK